MTTSARQRAMEVFEAALEKPAGERDAFIDAACGGDAALRAEVESLLQADAAAAGFLEPPSAPAPPPADTADPLVGTKIGRYHIHRLIAAGGMGRVYEAVQDEPHRTVALKLLHLGMASRSALQRFRHESEILGRLRHPGIAQIYEAGTQGGERGAPYFAMEYIPGARSITQYAADATLSTRARLSLFIQVCDAVQAGHQRGVIHRDLKPANILVDEHGQPKLIDFGVARATDADMTIATLQTDVGELVGTLRYMSPEQCEGDAGELDTRSDVYALGVVLYELLTGQLPYDLSTTSPFDVPRVIREQEPRRLSAVNRVLRGDIETIVLKALEKAREHRYQSVPDLQRDLEHYLAGEPIEAKRGRRWYVLCKTLRRHRVAVLVAAAFVLVVTAALAGLTVLYHDSERQRITAERRAEELRHAVYLNDITLAQGAYEAGDSAELARRLAVCPPDLRGWEWRYLQRLADTSVRTLTAHNGEVNALAISPDSRLIATGGYGYELNLWDGATGELLRTFPTEGYAEEASFSPEGRYLACAGREHNQAYVWDVATGERVDRFVIRTDAAVVFSPDGRCIAAGGYFHEPLRVWGWPSGELVREWPDIKRERPMNIAWSPDSTQLASARTDGTVLVLDVASGEVVQSFTGHTRDIRRVAFSPDGRLLASSGWDNTIRLWDLESGTLQHVLGSAHDWVNMPAFSADSRRVATGGASAVLVWDCATGQPEAVRMGHTAFVGNLAFSPDGKHLVSVSADGTAKMWDAAPLAEPAILATSASDFSALAVSPDGRRLAAGDCVGQLWVIDMPRGEETVTAPLGNGRLWTMAYDQTGRRLATGDGSGAIRIWEASFDAPIATLTGPRSVLHSLAWSGDDSRIAAGHDNGVVCIWDVATGEIVQTLAAHEGTVYDVAYTSDGRQLVTSGPSGARVWELATGELVHDLPTRPVGNVAALSSAGDLIAVGTKDREVWLWDAATGTPLWHRSGHVNMLQDITFLPNENRVVSGDYHGQIIVWDVETGAVALSLRGHESGIRAVAVAPDGSWLASASIDRTVRVWHAAPLIAPAP